MDPRSVSVTPSNQQATISTQKGDLLRIATDAPIVTERPGEHVYPEWPVGDRHLPHHIGYGEAALHAAVAYARGLFPGIKLQPVSNQGWSAVILADDHDRMYKVFRSARNYHEVEDEMAAIGTLHHIGLGPAPIVLVDAATDKRAIIRGEEREITFTDAAFCRVATAGDYPIIVMECATHTSIGTLSKADKIVEFDRVLEILAKHSIVPVDAEPVVDTTTGHVVLLDAGNISRVPQRAKLDAHASGRWEKGHPELSDAQVQLVEITFWLLLGFKGWYRRERVLSTLLHQGRAGIHQLLVE